MVKDSTRPPIGPCDVSEDGLKGNLSGNIIPRFVDFQHDVSLKILSGTPNRKLRHHKMNE